MSQSTKQFTGATAEQSQSANRDRAAGLILFRVRHVQPEFLMLQAARKTKIWTQPKGSGSPLLIINVDFLFLLSFLFSFYPLGKWDDFMVAEGRT